MTMSKIAEQKAKDIAKKLEESQAYKFDNFSVVCGAIEGYDQAMQDFLEKAIRFLNENLLKVLLFDVSDKKQFVEQFKNYMQDE